MFEAILFYVFSAAAVFSAILVITRRNPVNSAVALLATFASVAALYILMNAPFIAMVQITVYAGAILVLILFTIMLLNLREIGEGMFDVSSSGHITAGVLLAAVFAAELIYLIVSPKSRAARPLPAPAREAAESMGNTQAIGDLLFSQYVWPFEVVSILLVVAIVGAVILTRKRGGGTISVLLGEDEKEGGES